MKASWSGGGKGAVGRATEAQQRGQEGLDQSDLGVEAFGVESMAVG